MEKFFEKLREEYGRSLINNEWLNRLWKNDIAEIFPQEIEIIKRFCKRADERDLK